VSWTMTNEDLIEAFSAYGNVTQASIVMDRETNRSRGFAFVTFESPEAASAAIESLDGQELKGRQVRVSLAQQKTGDRRPDNRRNDRRDRDFTA
jgi:cold-inducible RNA-binding protein